LYNAGSFFDSRAVPPEDDQAIADAVSDAVRVTVESHPRLVGDRTWRFRDRLAPALEVAMGLETAHPDALARLNKGCTVADFAAAAAALAAHGVGLRVFLLVDPPFVPRPERAEWLRRSIDVAIDAGASVVSLIPTRGDSGAMPALAATGAFAPPTLAEFETSAALALSSSAIRSEPSPDPRRSLGSGSVRDLRRLPRRTAGATAVAEPRTARSGTDCLRHVWRRAACRGRRMPLIPRLTVDADVAIVGSGFAGALTALILRRQGRSVALLERGRHPRFAIGESTTPITNLVLEELADRWDLPRLRPFSKWGTWRTTYPDVACGLKRGFTFFRHDLDRAFADTTAHERQLLVAASPNDDISDTHWYRPDFDHWLVREAEREGVRYVDELGAVARALRGRAGDPGRGAARPIRQCGPGSSSMRAGRAASWPRRWASPRRRRSGCRDAGCLRALHRRAALGRAQPDRRATTVSDRRRGGAPRLPGGWI
jgi:hypothetical protein